MVASQSTAMFSARQAGRVFGRGLALGRRKVTESLIVRRFDSDEYRLLMGQRIFDLVAGQAALQPLLAMPYPPFSVGYNRVSEEKSNCPRLKTRHGHTGIFIVAKMLTEDSAEPQLQLTSYEDSVRNAADKVVKQQMTFTPHDLPISQQTNYKLPKLPVDGVTQSPQPVNIQQLLAVERLVVEGFVTTNQQHVNAAISTFNSRVAQYLPLLGVNQELAIAPAAD